MSDDNLLQKCLHGITQHNSESLNGVIWKRCPKDVFVARVGFIMGLKTKSELPKLTENQVAQSSRDVKNFGHIVKDFKISLRKMREFDVKHGCFRRTYFMFRSLIKGALNDINMIIFHIMFYKVL